MIRSQVYAGEHKGLPKDLFHSIDWDANGDALKVAPTLFGLWLMKHAAGVCGTGKWMKRWGYWDNNCYVSCGAENEDTKHLYFCPDFERHDG